MNEFKGSKEGIFTKDEVKALWGIVQGEIGIPVIFKPIANMIIPGILDGLENKVTEKIPENWQIICEDLVTKTVAIIADGKVTEQEAEELGEFAAKVLDTKINIPLLDDAVEVVVFLETFKLLSVMLYNAVNKKRMK